MEEVANEQTEVARLVQGPLLAKSDQGIQKVRGLQLGSCGDVFVDAMSLVSKVSVSREAIHSSVSQEQSIVARLGCR